MVRPVRPYDEKAAMKKAANSRGKLNDG